MYASELWGRARFLRSARVGDTAGGASVCGVHRYARYGQFEFLVLPFGLCNAPATCMRYMQHVLRDYLDKFVIVYMDDICIFSDGASHAECVEKVLRRLEEANLELKREKCTFGADSISYLGHVISREGVSMDPSKIHDDFRRGFRV